MHLLKIRGQAGRTWPIVVLVIFVCAAAVLLFPPTRDALLKLVNPYQTPAAPQNVQASWNDLDAGNFDAAIASAEPYINASSSVRSQARAIYEAASFYGGTSSDQRVKAVDAAIQDFQRTPTPFFKAIAVNKLLSYLMTGRNQYIFDEVFKYQPFSQYEVPGDWLGSIRKLAQYSLSLYPTVQAQEREAFWYAEQLTNYSGEYNVKPADVPVYVERILAIADQLDAGYDQYEKNYYLFSINTPLHSHDSVVMDREFWKAYLYGSAAQGGNLQYLQKAKQAIDLMQSTADAAVDAQGKKITSMTRFIPEARVIYAEAIFKAKGSAGYDEIRAQLDRAVADINANPSQQEGVYLAKVRNYATEPNKHPVMIQLAAIDPSYKALLIKYGWHFDAATSTAATH